MYIYACVCYNINHLSYTYAHSILIRFHQYHQPRKIPPQDHFLGKSSQTDLAMISPVTIIHPDFFKITVAPQNSWNFMGDFRLSAPAPFWSKKSSSKPQSTRPHQHVRLGCPIPAKFRTHGWLIVQPPRILVDSNSSKRLKIVHVRRQLFVAGAVFGESLVDSWSAKCWIFPYKMRLQSAKTKLSGRTDGFGSCLDHGQICRT